MIYKEWLSVRWKLPAIAFVYLALGLVSYNGWNNLVSGYLSFTSLPNNPPFFIEWMGQTQWITQGLAVLLGADAIAGERSQGTIVFLLTKPISRTRVYLTKLAFNAGMMTVALVAISLVMFWLDQQNAARYGNVHDYKGTHIEYVTGGYYTAYDPVTSIGDAVVITLGILGLGLAWLCMTTLISIALRSSIVAIIAGLITIVGINIAFSELNQRFFDIRQSLPELFQYPWFTPGMLLVAFAFLMVGLFSFRHWEF